MEWSRGSVPMHSEGDVARARVQVVVCTVRCGLQTYLAPSGMMAGVDKGESEGEQPGCVLELGLAGAQTAESVSHRNSLCPFVLLSPPRLTAGDW